MLALANVLGIESSRLRFVNVVAGTLRRRSGGLDLQVEVDSGNSTTPMSSDNATALTEQVGNLTTNDLSQAFNGATVASFSAQAIVVIVPELPIQMADGVPYVLMNVTTLDGIDSGDIQRSIAAFIAAHSVGSPLNETTEVNVIIANVFEVSNATTDSIDSRFT